MENVVSMGSVTGCVGAGEGVFESIVVVVAVIDGVMVVDAVAPEFTV